MGGDALPVVSVGVECNGTYGLLPVPSRSGYLFAGWFTDSNTSVTSSTPVNIPSDHTLYAHWEEVTAQVEIVFGISSLSDEDIREVISEYTGGNDFVIVRVESDAGETRVIVMFNDKEAAENFVVNIKKSSDVESKHVKRVDFSSDNITSYSPLLHPVISFLLTLRILFRLIDIDHSVRN